jgi:hypothetical protein
MKSTILKILVSFFFFSCFFSNVNLAQDVWSKTYGNSGIGYSIQTTEDNGFIVSGVTSSYGAEHVDILLIKLDKDGNQEFLKLFPQGEYGYTVKQTKDKGFILGGISWVSASRATSVIIKTDSLAETSWTKVIETENSEWIHSVIQTSDNGFVLTGRTISTSGQLFGPWLRKMDENGNLLWAKEYFDYATSVANVIESADSNYIIAGDDGGSLLLLKVNNSGDILWSKSYPNFRTARCFHLTEDGGYVISGSGSIYGNVAYVVKTDSVGKLLWSKTFGENSTYKPKDIIQTKDKGYMVCGYKAGENFWDSEAWLLKLDESGEQEWNKTYNQSGESLAWSVTQAIDGGYVFTGETYNPSNNGSMCWIVKTDSLGNADVATDIPLASKNPSNFKLLQNYPNPFNPSTVIKYSLAEESKVVIKIYNILGSEVATLENRVQSPGSYTTEFDGTNLPSGIYFYSLEVGKYRETRKMVLLR